MLVKSHVKKKVNTGVFDYLKSSMGPQKGEKSDKLLIDPTQNNPVDALFAIHFFKGTPFHPAKLKGWFAIGVNGDKRIKGRIVDVLQSRDLLVKMEDGTNSIIPFNHVKILKPNTV